MIRDQLKAAPGLRQIVHSAFLLESWWFDKWHNVNTQEDDYGNRDYTINFRYVPTRPGRVRLILRDLCLTNCSDYTLIDFGSGKGRTVLIAAHYPFRAVRGIELRQNLHEQALENMRRCRHLPIRCGCIEFLNMNAADYEFPDCNLVLYFFNPFGPEVMERLLTSLDASLERRPRDVFVAMYHPEYAFLLNRMSRLRLFKHNVGHHLYRSCVASMPECSPDVGSPDGDRSDETTHYR